MYELSMMMESKMQQHYNFLELHRTIEAMRFQATSRGVNNVCESLLGDSRNSPKDVFFLIWNNISYDDRVVRDDEDIEFVFADFETKGSNKRHNKKGRKVSKEFRLRWMSETDDNIER